MYELWRGLAVACDWCR